MKLAYADELAIGLAGEHVVCADLDDFPFEGLL